MKNFLSRVFLQIYIVYKIVLSWVKQQWKKYVVTPIQKIVFTLDEIVGKTSERYKQRQEETVLNLMRKREDEWRKTRLPYLQQLTRATAGTNMDYFFKHIQTTDPLIAIAERLTHTSHSFEDRYDDEIEKTILERVYGKIADWLKGGKTHEIT